MAVQQPSRTLLHRLGTVCTQLERLVEENQQVVERPVPYIQWPDEDRLLVDILIELIDQHGLYGLLDIPGVREPLVRWFRDAIRARYQVSQPPCVERRGP